MNTTQSEKVGNGRGFFAALDQSGGSTPKALAEYGIEPDRYSNDTEMFDLVHAMRTRVFTSPAFDGSRILAAILFEQTMERDVAGVPTAQYLWEEKNVVPFLKVDLGLADEQDDVQLMKPIDTLDDLLERAQRHRIFGTKMRSVIKDANEAGIAAIVDQQFEYAGRIMAAGLVPIMEPEVSISSPHKEQAEALLHDAIDSVAAGLTIFDADDRLVIFNSGNNELYADDLGLVRGQSFEDVARLALTKGHYADAVGREEEWVAERVACHHAATGSTEQRLSDGRWLLITERRMRNGGIVSLRVDITALKQAQAALSESEARLERAQATAKIGSWEVDVATNRYVWSKEMFRLRGLPEGKEPPIDRVIGTLHPDDLEGARQ